MSARIDTLARDLVSKREAYEKAAAEEKRLKKEFKAAQEDFWDTLDDLGMTTFTADLGPGFGSVQFQKRETIRGIVKDQDRAVAAIEEAGLSDELLGNKTIRQKVLSEYMRDWLASGQAIPEGLDFNPTRYVSITRK